VAVRLFSPLYFSIIGYSDYDKSRADAGFSFEWRQDLDKQISFALISLDHYFNDKKDEASDLYLTRPYLWYHQGKWRWEGQRFSWMAANHSLLHWRRELKSYDYRYERWEADASYERDIALGWTLFLHSSLDFKRESKDWYSSQDNSEQEVIYSKSLARMLGHWKAGAVKLFDERHYVVSNVSYGSRHAKYKYRNPSEPPDMDLPEPMDQSEERQDFMLSSQYVAPFFYQNQSMVYGMFFAWPQIKNSDATRQSFELKPQLAWQFRIKSQASILLNATFDLDETITEFPYKNGFPGWDGGNAQFQIVF
jgi:hypothetical protein